MVGLGVHPETASAHGDGGTMTVITAEQDGPLAIHLVVGIVYGNDGDPATGATVSVTGTGPDGAKLAETRLPRQQGAKYGATFDVPAKGSWRLTVTSGAPEATATATVEVTEELPTTEPATTAAGPAGTSEPPGTTGPSETTVAPSIEPRTADAPGQSAAAEKDDSTNWGLIAVVGGIVLVVVIAGGLAVRSKRTDQTDSRPE